jgi:hypothetical protein
MLVGVGRSGMEEDLGAIAVVGRGVLLEER